MNPQFIPVQMDRYPCPGCERHFKDKKNLVRHVQYECGQEPRFQCPYCELKSKRPSCIYLHIRKRHGESKSFCYDMSVNPPEIKYPQISQSSSI